MGNIVDEEFTRATYSVLKKNLKDSIQEKIINKYGIEVFYNDLDSFLEKNNTIDSFMENCFFSGFSGYIDSKEYVDRIYINFVDINRRYLPYNSKIKSCIEELFTIIFDAFNSDKKSDEVRIILNHLKEYFSLLNRVIAAQNSNVNKELSEIKKILVSETKDRQTIVEKDNYLCDRESLLSNKTSVQIKYLLADIYKNFFLTIGIAIYRDEVLDYEMLYESTSEIFTGFLPNNAYLIWKLLNTSIIKALIQIVEKSKSWIVKDKISELIGNIDNIFFDEPYLHTDCRSFFLNPTNLQVYKVIKSIFAKWQKQIKINNTILKRNQHFLDLYFIDILSNESMKEEYVRIGNIYQIYISEAVKEKEEWRNYSKYLKELVNKQMIFESFSLQQVYIPLNAYFFRKKDPFEHNSDEQKIVINLHSYFLNWLENENRSSSIRIISGGPGSGKSTFVKILAAEISEYRNVIFIPLYQIQDFMAEVEDFTYEIVNTFLSINPLKSNKEIVLIYDGLDELALQGKSNLEYANQFLASIIKYVNRMNQINFIVKVIITGRELVIGRNEGLSIDKSMIIYLLPYCVINKEEYFDIDGLLNYDNRIAWWEKYSELKGREYKQALELIIKNKKLNELSQQPLLNYLIAFGYENNKELYERNDININVIYRGLIKQVYNKVYDNLDIRNKPYFNNIKEEDFIQLLEEIALAAWHNSSGRLATLDDVIKQCERDNLIIGNELLAKISEIGVFGLLTAFYFRKTNIKIDHHETYEFTHKSFFEYLVARSFVRHIDLIIDQMNKNNLSVTNFIQKFMDFCLFSEVDSYIIKFLIDELSLKSVETVINYQNTILKIIKYLLYNIFPNNVKDRKIILILEKINIISECILSVLHACSSNTKQVSDFKLKNEYTFVNWINKILPEGKESMILLVLNYINISEQNLSHKNFAGINLENSILSHCNFENANLKDAKLQGANLTNAILYRTLLNRADLRNTIMNVVDLRNADLKNTNLQNAVLNRSEMDGIDLSFADMSNADFKWVNMNHANLQEAILNKVDFYEANLNNVDLTKAKQLNEANFCKAKLREAKFMAKRQNVDNYDEEIVKMERLLKKSQMDRDINAVARIKRMIKEQRNLRTNESVLRIDIVNLSNARMQETDLYGVDLNNANLEDANLRGANLNRAILKYANLNRVNLIEASLRNTDLEYAKLINAKLIKVDLNKAILRETRLNNANLTEADLREAKLTNANLNSANLSSAILTKVDLRGANLSSTILTKADLSRANLNNANLSSAILTKADLSMADLSGVMLAKANLSGANLIEARLDGADLSGANLIEARLDGADLRGVNFNGANLNKATFTNAILDKSTKFTKAILDGVIDLKM